MVEQVGDPGREWITLGDFARRLGIARASVYGRIKRGTLEARRANRGGYLVQWPPPDHDGSGDVALQERDHRDDGSATVAHDVVALRVEVARLEERLVASERREVDLTAALAVEREEKAQLWAALAEARKPALVRLIEAL